MDQQTFALFSVMRRLKGNPEAMARATKGMIEAAAEIELMSNTLPEIDDDKLQDEFRRAFAEYKVLKRVEGAAGTMLTHDIVEAATDFELLAGKREDPALLEQEFVNLDPKDKRGLEEFIAGAPAKKAHPWLKFLQKVRPKIIAKLKSKGMSGREMYNQVFKEAAQMWKSMSPTEKQNVTHN